MGGEAYFRLSSVFVMRADNAKQRFPIPIRVSEALALFQSPFVAPIFPMGSPA
jgi:hypothetical protein